MTIMLNGRDLTVTQVAAAARHGEAVALAPAAIAAMRQARTRGGGGPQHQRAGVRPDPSGLNPAARAGSTPRYHAPMQDQSRVLIGARFRAEGAEAARAPANPFFTPA